MMDFTKPILFKKLIYFLIIFEMVTLTACSMEATLDSITPIIIEDSKIEIKVPLAESNGISAGLVLIHLKDANGKPMIGFTPELSLSDGSNVTVQCLSSNNLGTSVCTFQSTVAKVLDFQVSNIARPILKGSIEFKAATPQTPGLTVGAGISGVYGLYRPRVNKPKDPDLNQNTAKVAVTTFGESTQADTNPPVMEYMQNDSNGVRRARLGMQGVLHK